MLCVRCFLNASFYAKAQNSDASFRIWRKSGFADYSCQGNVVAISPDILPVRANYLNDVRAKIRRDCLRLNSVVEELVRQGRAFTVDDIVARYVARKSELSFSISCTM